MAIPVPTSVELAFGGNNRNAALSSNFPLVGGLTMQSIYKVLFDTMPTRAADVLYATGVPQVGDGLTAEGDRPDMWVTNTRVVEVQEDRHFFHVLIDYSSQWPAAHPTESLIPRVSVDFRERSIPAGKDTADVAIVNTAGLPFDPAITVTKTDMVLTVTDTLVAFILSEAITYTGSINKYAITVVGEDFAAGTLKMVRLGTSGWVSDYGSIAWPVTYVMEYRDTGWNTQNIVSAGYHAFGDSSPAKLGKIQLDDGTWPSDPLPLTADGKRMSSADILATGLHYMNFKLYEELDWSSLGIPDKFPTELWPA